MKSSVRRSLVVIAIGFGVGTLRGQQPATEGQEAFRFKSGVDLINVSATVSDRSGRFVPGLRKEDFVVYEDDVPVEVTHFSAERVPVSLGITLDASGSMEGDKMRAARGALNRFLGMLMNGDDEMFLYQFSNVPELVQAWESNPQPFVRALDRVQPNGGTAMYDAIVEAVPLVATGHHRKKALLILSDGRDTSSSASVMEAKSLIRESEALVYAVGIDCGSEPVRRGPTIFQPAQRGPVPRPFPQPGGRVPWPTPVPRLPQPPDRGTWMRGCNDPVDIASLRDLTDDSGGRTEIIRDARDLEPATTGIADELSRQYYLGYPAAAKKDGRWHTIRVEVRNQAYRVRARRGYLAN
jgi:VWFA-related protein